MKKIFTLLLSLIFALSLVACGDETGGGGDGGGTTQPDDKNYEVKVTSVNLPAFIRKWESNKAEQTNKQTEFYDRTQEYVVGDDNEFFVQPVVSFVKVHKETGETKPAIVKEWEYVLTVYVKDAEGNYQKLEAENEYIESIDSKTCGINFSEQAIGKNFQVEVYPAKLSENQMAQVSKYTKTVKFRVIEGYNAYDALDLAYIENRTATTPNLDERQKAGQVAWAEFKEEKGIDTTINPSNIIFHADIEVTKNDIPGFFFYTADEVSTLDSDYHRVIGSMKDYYEIYYHHFSENEEFRIIGNYFKLDCSKLSVVVREDGAITPEGTVVSHSQLIRYDGALTGQGRLENLRVVGNAGRSENALLSGGLILIKIQNVDVTAYNNISVNTFIHYFANLSSNTSKTTPNETTFTVEKCKGYDAFNSFIYNWGAHFIIKDSELIGSGGPVIIQDHTYSTQDTGYSKPKTEVINSRLESFVTGEEGWFKIMQSDTIVPQIKALSQVFAPKKSFLASNGLEDEQARTFLNLICVNKSGEAQSFTKSKIGGTLIIDGVYYDYGENSNPYLAAMHEQTYENGAPLFQTAAGGFAYFNGSGLIDIQGNQIIDQTSTMYQGDTLCLYYMGMAITLGYFDADFVYEAK